VAQVINGKKGDVPRAKNQLLRELQTQAKVEISVPVEHHRFIIGRGGETMKEIQERTGARIFVPRVGATCRGATSSPQQANGCFRDADIITLRRRLLCYCPPTQGEEESEIIRIIGTTDCIRKAVQEIQLISDERSKLDVVRMPVLKVCRKPSLPSPPA